MKQSLVNSKEDFLSCNGVLRVAQYPELLSKEIRCKDGNHYLLRNTNFEKEVTLSEDFPLLITP